MQILQLHLEREEKSKLTFAPSTNSNRNRKSVDESQQPVSIVLCNMHNSKTKPLL